VLWNSIKVFEIQNDNPTILKYKTSYNEKTFKNINVHQKKRKSIDFNIPELRTLTTSGTISDAKKNNFYLFVIVMQFQKVIGHFIKT